MSLYNFLAYIDPGTGSLVFQVLAATAMGVVVAFQSVRLWIVNFFKLIVGKKQASTEVESTDDEDSNHS